MKKKVEPMLQEWLSISQVARRLAISNSMVRKLIRQGKLSARRTTLGALMAPEDVDALKKERISSGLAPQTSAEIGNGPRTHDLDRPR